jgi:hypothetical protein
MGGPCIFARRPAFHSQFRCLGYPLIRLGTSGQTHALQALPLRERSEGLLLNPVYGGKAFAGLIAAIREGAWPNEEPVLFVMTGGLPSQFAYQLAFRQN